MDDLDRALARLAVAPFPAALEQIEAQVLLRMDARPVSRRGTLGIGGVAIAAMTIGIVGAGIPATASPLVSLDPLSGAMPLAPSTLLSDGR